MSIPNVNAHARSEQDVTASSTFWTVTSSVNFLMSSSVGGSAASQAVFDKLVEIISINGQPVILGMPLNPSAGVFTVSFMIEHAGSWFPNDAAKHGNLNAQSFAAALDADGIDVGLTSANTTLAVSPAFS